MTKAIQIDASSHCQLACPSCPTADGSTRPALGAGHLKPGDFIALLDANPDLEEIELSNYGEMFLNPALPEILRAAFERKVVLHADNGVNLNFIHSDALDALVKYGFRSLTVSLDGASAKTYSQYRVKGDFDRVIANIRRINDLKRRHQTGFPYLVWQFIVFGHNEHEIGTAKKLAGELGMHFIPKLSWEEGFSPIRNRDLVQIALGSPHLNRAEYRAATGQDYQRSICYQLWRRPVLNWDGRLIGCCRNFWGDFGAHAFRDGLQTSVESEPFRYAKQMLMGQAEPRAGIPCTTCDLYLTMRDDKRWITREEVSPPAGRAILLSVFVEPGNSEATHADVFLYPGHALNRMALAEPPRAIRVEIGKDFSAMMQVPGPGDYTLCALPKRLDPAYRKHYPPMDAVTKPVTITSRPIAQQLSLTL